VVGRLSDCTEHALPSLMAVEHISLAGSSTAAHSCYVVTYMELTVHIEQHYDSDAQ
jgi:hypothetical protein